LTAIKVNCQKTTLSATGLSFFALPRCSSRIWY